MYLAMQFYFTRDCLAACNDHGSRCNSADRASLLDGLPSLILALSEGTLRQFDFTQDRQVPSVSQTPYRNLRNIPGPQLLPQIAYVHINAAVQGAPLSTTDKRRYPFTTHTHAR